VKTCEERSLSTIRPFIAEGNVQKTFGMLFSKASIYHI